MRCKWCGGLPDRLVAHGVMVCGCGSLVFNEPQHPTPDSEVIQTCRELVGAWDAGDGYQPQMERLKELIT